MACGDRLSGKIGLVRLVMKFKISSSLVNSIYVPKKWNDVEENYPPNLPPSNLD